MKIFQRLFISLLLCSAFAGNATHLKGGYIYWECQGNGQYIFKMDLLKDNHSQTASLPASATILGPTNIPVIRQTIATDSCAFLEIHHYESAPVTLQGAPPATGWELTWSNCCRPSTVVSINAGAYFIRSVMYPDSTGCNAAPVMNQYQGLLFRDSTGATLNLSATPANPSDSLFYQLHPAFVSNTQTVTYNTGYSAQNPLPNSNIDSLNQDAALDSLTGLLKYRIRSGISGLYVLVNKIETWRAGQLVSETFYENSLLYNSFNLPNEKPEVIIDTASHPRLWANSPIDYVARSFPGDTLRFIIAASDSDTTAFGRLQTITFSGSGLALAAPFGQANFISNAQVSPVAPQSGFSDSLSNQILFEWTVGSEHIVAGGQHFFIFSFEDDDCGVQNISLKVNVAKTAIVPPDSLFICQGDTAVLWGNTASCKYDWTPNIAINNPALRYPWVSPASTLTYYLEDPDNPGQKDSVVVVVDPKGIFDLSALGSGQLYLDDATSPLGATDWFFNGLPFTHPSDTLTPFAPGSYWAARQTQACSHSTDTVAVASSNLYTNIEFGNGLPFPGGGSVLLYGSASFTFQLSSAASGGLQKVFVPAVEDISLSAANSIRLKIYDENRNPIWRTERDLTGAAGEVQVFEISPPLYLSANKEYTFSLIGDSGLAFQAYLGVRTPYSPTNNGIAITDLYGNFNDSTISQNLSSQAYPVGMQIQHGVGLAEENLQEVRIFPNPAKDVLTIGNLPKNSQLRIWNVQGKILWEGNAQGESHTIHRQNWADGLYWLEVKNTSNFTVEKIIFE